MIQSYKSMFLRISVVILTLCSIASANKCTEAVFKLNANTYINKIFNIQIDSIYINTGIEKTLKFFYSNNQLDSILQYSSTTGNKPQVQYFYSDTNETVLRKQSYETISKNCSTQDTICFHDSSYNNGINGEIDHTIKATDSYIATIEIDGESYFVHEYSFQQDTVIETITLNYRDYGKNDTKTEKKFYIADKEDNFKCNQYDEKGVLKENTLYVPTPQGYSLKVTTEDSFKEIFFISNQNTTSICKNFKPVKLTPKASHFDLLGRYKFSK